ncbi:MAG: hypothetical protein IPP90_19170 [Gemmatimonadaceae bacterium]|nr:hypothetical protein [Gemmatimonadaceae bacterium]
MTTNFNRLLAGAVALLAGVAALDVTGLLAQALPTSDGAITSTTCSVGTLTECGRETIQKCEWKFDINLNILGRSGGFSGGRFECRDYGFKTLYKDKNSSTSSTSCPTVGGGSQGTGLTGTRGSGDELSDDLFCLE